MDEFPFFPKRKQQLFLDDNESLNSVILGLVWTNFFERIESNFFSKAKSTLKEILPKDFETFYDEKSTVDTRANRIF